MISRRNILKALGLAPLAGVALAEGWDAPAKEEVISQKFEIAEGVWYELAEQKPTLLVGDWVGDDGVIYRADGRPKG